MTTTLAWAAGNGDRSENGNYIYGKKRLREIDRRLRFLIKRIESAVVVDPARQKNRDRVFFGATVTYVDADGGLDDEESCTIRGLPARSLIPEVCPLIARRQVYDHFRFLRRVWQFD